MYAPDSHYYPNSVGYPNKYPPDSSIISRLRTRQEYELFLEAERCLRCPIVRLERSQTMSGEERLYFSGYSGQVYIGIVRSENWFYSTKNVGVSCPPLTNESLKKAIDSIVTPKAPCPKCKGANHDGILWYGMCTVQVRAFWNRARKVYWAHHSKVRA